MENYKFFQNRSCEYFPCHNLPEDELNCLFCYCPLYCLGKECGGDFEYTKNGIKSCMNCTKPHGKDGYEHIMGKMKHVMEKTRITE
ncbi:MAG: cysteine-rich small domain-containing protein [Alistipes sp.]|nr:cysteine-rich small domain-containing protein [Alistipes sp.]